jgi:3-methyladenine DNA glycosylase AlkD
MQIEEVIRLFCTNANAELAVAMSNYMKNNFPFLGIPKPKRIVLQKPFLNTTKKSDTIQWDEINMLWQSTEREFQYLALEYLQVHKSKLTPSDFTPLKCLITTKSWWDSIDIIAPNLLGHLLSKYPKETMQEFDAWLETDHVWLNRCVILSQLRYKNQTNIDLLEKCILKNLNSKEFFINKAIGWALREYAKTNPEYVLSFVNSTTLHSLSKREAIKHLSKAK